MNIFFLDEDIECNAKYHCNTHCIVAPKELMQMMSTNMTFHGLKGPLKSTHVNHPSTKWMRESKGNFIYSLELCKAVCKEYTYRYEKEHHVEQYFDSIIIPELPDDGFTSPALVMPEKYRVDDYIEAYRNYYIGEKLCQSGWRWEYKNRMMPDWALSKLK